MRTSELLKALAQADPGIQCLLSANRATVTTLYMPGFRGLGKTLFDAALQVAKSLRERPDCPQQVKEALEAYDQHTAFLET
jgi:hypothetical protein